MPYFQGRSSNSNRLARAISPGWPRRQHARYQAVFFPGKNRRGERGWSSAGIRRFAPTFRAILIRYHGRLFSVQHERELTFPVFDS